MRCGRDVTILTHAVRVVERLHVIEFSLIVFEIIGCQRIIGPGRPGSAITRGDPWGEEMGAS
jgi:hypothetical protein